MKISQFSFWLFLLVLFLAPLLGGAPTGPEYAGAAFGGDGVGGCLRILTLFAGLLAAVAAERERPKETIPGTVARWGIYGVAIWVAISLAIHSRFFTSPVYQFAMIPEALNWLTFAVVFALAARFTSEAKGNLPKMAMALLAGGMVCAVFGMLGFGAVPLAERAQHREPATFFSPNFAAGFAALLLPLAVAVFLAAERVWLLVSGAAVFLLFALLMVTGSRAGLALALIGLVIAFALALGRLARERSTDTVTMPWKKVAIVVAIIAVAGVAFLAPIRGRSESPSSATVSQSTVAPDSSGDHSGDFRKATWKGTLAMASANPVIGTGPGTFPYTNAPYSPVAWTAQAHSSYLQLAGESGFPALILLLIAIGGSITAGFSRNTKLTLDNPFLVPALIGGAIAAAGRSVFDSEWMLLGLGIPFFAVLGMLVGKNNTPILDTAKQLSLTHRGVNAALFAAALLLAIVLRNGQSERDSLIVADAKNRGSVSAAAKEAASRIRPADPQLYALAGDYLTAASLSPSGKRLFQLARYFESQGDEARAVIEFKKAADADPNNLQTRKALAEAQIKTGDTGGAILTYGDMIDIAEGPAGKIRAIPELTDTLPAFAYTAVAEDALQRGDATAAETNFAKAQQIVEDYSRTPQIYQLSEALTLSNNTANRRAEVRALYTDRILPGRRAALKRLGKSLDASVSSEVEATTVDRIDKFVLPGQ